MARLVGARQRPAICRFFRYFEGKLSVVAGLMAAIFLSGCASGPQTGQAAFGRNATIAFESIDGLPPNKFDELVRFLSEEAQTRELAVVRRDSPSQFRARGYASAQVRGRQTIIAWVWDIYNTDQQRAVRISGEQPATGKARGWAAADEQVLRGIARDSLAQLAGFLDNPGEAPPAAPPAASGPVVASGGPIPNQQPPVLESLAAFAAHADR